MANEILLTEEGKLKLEERLRELELVKRAEVAEKIKEARAFGDLSENAEYDAAKEEQAIIESEIIEITNKLHNAIIINEENLDTKTVSVGCFVKVQNLDTGSKTEYKIVGSTETNIDENKISNESPLGQNLIGKKKNAEFEFAIVKDGKELRKLRYKILGIRV